MTQPQKRILRLLGLATITIIGILITAVIITTRTTSQTAPSEPAQIPKCLQIVLETLPPTASRSITWNENVLQLTIRVRYTTSSPPADSAQHLWEAFDSIATALQHRCPAPETINIAVTAQTATTTHRHQAQISGKTVAAWANGDLSEAEMAETVKYRRTIP